MKKFIKQLFCKHEYKTIYNIYGDMINRCGGHRRMDKCTKCGKEKLGDKLNPNCRKINGQ